MLGRIKSFRSDRGFGFIVDEVGLDRFFHISNVEGQRHLLDGEVVSFEPYLQKKDRYAATAVRIVQSANRTEVLHEISEWKRESKLEDMFRYFYYTQDIASLENGNRCYVLGRKGTGKTAIGEYLLSQSAHNRFIRKLSFKNFPFKELYALSNHIYNAPNQYITLWKYLIYSTIAQLILPNEAIDADARHRLSSIYESSLENTLSRNLREWTGRKLGLTILGTGGNIETTRSATMNEQNWITRVEVLEEFLLQYLDNAQYIIVFDELDEDYTHIRSSTEIVVYLALLISLFKAVQDIKSLFSTGRYRVLPIVLLRDDIFERLSDSDKSKWEDLTLRLSWHTEKIRHLLAFRISRAVDPTADRWTFDEAWGHVFSPDPIIRKGAEAESIFSYLSKRTLRRPRDYIVCLKECAQCALDLGNNLVTTASVMASRRRIASYMRSEFEDELGGRLPDIKDIFNVLTIVGKQTFTTKDFTKVYEETVRERGLEPLSPSQVLQALFEHSAIGNHLRDGRHVFKFMDPRVICSMDRPFVVLRGLYESLQLI